MQEINKMKIYQNENLSNIDKKFNELKNNNKLLSKTKNHINP